MGVVSGLPLPDALCKLTWNAAYGEYFMLAAFVSVIVRVQPLCEVCQLTICRRIAGQLVLLAVRLQRPPADLEATAATARWPYLSPVRPEVTNAEG